MTQEGFDQVRQIRSVMNKSRALVYSGSVGIEESTASEGSPTVKKRALVKPISIREVASGKILNFTSIREAYLYLSDINKVSVSTISRNIDTGKSVKGYIFSSLKNPD